MSPVSSVKTPKRYRRISGSNQAKVSKATPAPAGASHFGKSPLTGDVRQTRNTHQSQLTRCLKLLHLVRSSVGCSIDYLAHEFGVSKRTVHRDLCRLREEGIPVLHDTARRGYILRPPFDIKTYPISGDELAAIMLAAHIFSLSCVDVLSQPIRQAIGKLLDQAPATIRDDVANLLNSVTGTTPPVFCQMGSLCVINEVFAALRRRRPIRIVYDSEEETTRPLRTKVTPRQLIVSHENWYLIGRSSWHRKNYRFALQHIQTAEQVESGHDSAETTPIEITATAAPAKHGREIQKSSSSKMRMHGAHISCD
jgi:predicted DNA-binding transcriptional regulator YafY